MMQRLRLRGALLVGFALLGATGASCGGKSASQPESASTSVAPRTSIAGADIGDAVDVGDGGVEVSPGSTRAAVPFDSFTPVPEMGWGADQAATALAYRPDPDGLQFPNAAPPRAFGVEDAVALFGADAVCASSAGECAPKPAAQAWIDQVSAASAGGVCEGMVVFSLDRFVAGAQPPSMQLALDDETNSRIVRLFATQFLPEVQQAAASRRGKTLAEVLGLIEAGLAAGGTPYTLGLYGDGGGHALVPYAVRRVSDSQAAVYVYDPNWPGLDRYVEFDLANETWRYSMNNANAAADTSPWFGTGDELDLVALSEREAPFDEPFAGAGHGTGRVLLTVTTGSRNWSIENGSDTITAATARPGRNSVIAVSRGASNLGISTYVIEVGGGVVVDAGDGAIDVFVEGERGTLRGTAAEDGARFGFANDGGFVLRQEAGAGSFTAYTTTGVVGGDAGASTEIGIEPDERVRIVDATGNVSEPTTVPPPTTVAQSTTSTTQPPNPPTNTNQVDVVITYAQTASGMVTLEVRKRTQTTLDFTVKVTGPSFVAGAGPVPEFAQTFQGLTVNANYVVTVTFTDGSKTVRNFTVP